MTHHWIRHEEHRHKLFLVNEGRIFTCNCCHEVGEKHHYKCTRSKSRCNFHLHIACAEVVPVITPPVYGYKYHFNFRKVPVDDHRYCVACGKGVRRYNYHCSEHNLDLHPSCTADFPLELKVDNVRLRLREKLDGSCNHCNRSQYGSGNLNTWAYVSDCKKYQYFAGCILDVRVSQRREVNHNQNRGRGPTVMDSVIAGADFFNAVVRVLTGLPF